VGQSSRLAHSCLCATRRAGSGCIASREGLWQRNPDRIRSPIRRLPIVHRRRAVGRAPMPGTRRARAAASAVRNARGPPTGRASIAGRRSRVSLVAPASPGTGRTVAPASLVVPASPGTGRIVVPASREAGPVRHQSPAVGPEGRPSRASPRSGRRAANLPAGRTATAGRNPPAHRGAASRRPAKAVPRGGPVHRSAQTASRAVARTGHRLPGTARPVLGRGVAMARSGPGYRRM
jgi:hypothetical protein